jgi:hypothetical protein
VLRAAASCPVHAIAVQPSAVPEPSDGPPPGAGSRPAP